MLEELRIRGLGVIDDATLSLGPGLTAVTGETGAGKTMVVTGLLLLFGGRADAARVRTGTDAATVDGRVTITDSHLLARVHDAGGEFDDGSDLALRRVVSSAGRSRAYVGGAPAPVSLLAELADRLVTVHGQVDQLRLTRRAEQLAVLDRYGEIDTAPYVDAFARWRRASDALAERTARASELRREAGLLEHGLAEIAAADPQPGEDAELAELVERLTHADALCSAARLAHDLLAGDPDDPASDSADAGMLLSSARRALGQVAGADAKLDELAARLDELAAAAADVAADLRGYGDTLDAEPARLEEVQSRRAVLSSLVRKYGDAEATVSAVLRWADSAAARLADLDVSDDALAALAAERDAAAAQAVALAGELTAHRTATAATLSAAVTAELGGLAMSGATFTAEIRPRAGSAQPGPGGTALGADGADDIEFLLTPHPQSPPVPLARGASGGELSRVMLALEVCLAGADPVPTMVFDEVDAGVGGRAAVEVGRRLAALARDRQVVVVTHLAQVAAYADRQIVVDKPPSGAARGGGGGGSSVTTSDVRIVTDEDRVSELARMLAGSDSSTAREHAAELLGDAARDKAPKQAAGRRKRK
ncbi:MAG: repair protein RecN [Pseudonocardiales bacterium]|nr:repair protein RecN [Pseudonocardiales bacterium]